MSAHEIAERAPKGRPQGGMKSDAGQAAYWRMQWESAIGALADLIAEHTEMADELKRVREGQRQAESKDCPHAAPFRYCDGCKATPCPIGLGGGR